MRLVLLITLKLFALSSAAEANPGTPKVHVIIISIDGAKPAVLHQSALPTLKKIINNGSSSWTAQTTSPSVTLPSHVSMLTGTLPWKHQVLWNHWEPKKGMITTTTIFQIARQSGLATAFFASKEKFRHFETPNTFNHFEIVDGDAKRVAEIAGAYLVAKQPRLSFVHFSDPDIAGHQFGWDSTEQIQSLQTVDQGLAILMENLKKSGLEKNTLLIITADHGGHDKGHGSERPEDMTIPWIASGATAKRNRLLKDKITTVDTAATALWILGIAVPASMDGKAVLNAFETVSKKPAAK